MWIIASSDIQKFAVAVWVFVSVWIEKIGLDSMAMTNSIAKSSWACKFGVCVCVSQAIQVVEVNVVFNWDRKKVRVL